MNGFVTSGNSTEQQSLRLPGRIFDINLPALKRMSALSQHEEGVLSESTLRFLVWALFRLL